MPWYGFTKYGVPDIPDPTSTVGTGQIFMFPSNAALDEDGLLVVAGPPHGFLVCNGATVQIVNYQALYDFFVANGLSFGAAAPGFFVLPNFQSRFVIGQNPSNPAFDTINETGGATTHSHTVTTTHTHTTAGHTHTQTNHDHEYASTHSHSLPSHQHGDGTLNIPTQPNYDNPLYSGSDASFAKDNHDHAVNGDSAFGGVVGVGDPRNSSGVAPFQSSTASVNNTTTSQGDTANGLPSSTITLSSSGGTDSIPPYYALHYVIKY